MSLYFNHVSEQMKIAPEHTDSFTLVIICDTLLA